MIDIFGWWVFDPDTKSLINKVTGERVRYLARLSGKFAPAEGNWLRFDYEHEGLSYPILVETGEIEYITSSNWRAKLGFGWQVDHIRSAELWARDRKAQEKHPPYGLWRRVDDCIADALRFWPEGTAAGIIPHRFLITGGWLNGAWSASWERIFRSVEKQILSIHAPFDIRNPRLKWLFPLEEKSHSRWEFHNDIGDKPEHGKYDQDIHSSFWNNYLRIRGGTRVAERDKLGEIIPGKYRYINTLNSQIKCIHNQTVYMESVGENFLLAFKSGPTVYDCDRVTRTFDFFYADEFIETTLGIVNYIKRSVPYWSVQIPAFYVPRHADWPDRCWNEPEEGPFAVRTPVLEMFRRTDIKIRDALLNWRGTDLKHNEWIVGYNLEEFQWLKVHGHYLGGVWFRGSEYAARITKERLPLSQISLKEIDLN